MLVISGSSCCEKEEAREHHSSVLSAGLIAADTVLPRLTEVMLPDRMATNESLAAGHTAAFNKSGCVILREKNHTISFELFFPPSLSAHKQISNNRLLFPVVAPGERTIYANN